MTHWFITRFGTLSLKQLRWLTASSLLVLVLLLLLFLQIQAQLVVNIPKLNLLQSQLNEIPAATQKLPTELPKTEAVELNLKSVAGLASCNMKLTNGSAAMTTLQQQAAQRQTLKLTLTDCPANTGLQVINRLLTNYGFKVDQLHIEETAKKQTTTQNTASSKTVDIAAELSL